MHYVNKYLVFFFCFYSGYRFYQTDPTSYLWLFFPLGLLGSVIMRDGTIKSESIALFQQQGGYIISHNAASDGYNQSGSGK